MLVIRSGSQSVFQFIPDVLDGAAGQSSSSPLNWENHFCMELVSCFNMTVPSCALLSKISFFML